MKVIDSKYTKKCLITISFLKFIFYLCCMDRYEQIIRTSIVGVIANIFLASFKALVGLISGSIAIIMDAVNNLSDVLSSVITIVGTKLSARPADAKHPFGHGRIEYFSAIIISIIIIIAGFSSLIESGKKIINPTVPDYTTLTLVVIIVAIGVKIVLGRYVKAAGVKLECDSLVASGADAIFDAIVTLLTLVSAVIMLVWKINLDGIFGLLISLFIIKTGFKLLGSPINQLLGLGVPKSLVNDIRNEVMNFPGVYGVFDIIMNYYGPETIIGSLHVNVADTMTASEIHGLTRKIAYYLHKEHNIISTVGIYAINLKDQMGTLQKEVTTYLLDKPYIASIHGFYHYKEEHVVTLDIVPNRSVYDYDKFFHDETEDLEKHFQGLHFQLVIDHNYTEE